MNSLEQICDSLQAIQNTDEFYERNVSLEILNLKNKSISLQNIIDLLSEYIKSKNVSSQICGLGVDPSSVNVDMSKPIIIKKKKKSLEKSVEPKSKVEPKPVEQENKSEQKDGVNTESKKSNTETTTAKSVKTKERKPLFILPFTGVINENKCFSIKLNYKLHTQCMNDKNKNGGYYCSTCQKNADNNEKDKGQPPYGDIRSRLGISLLSYVDPKGNKTLPYHKVLSKIKVKGVPVTREQVENEAKYFGLNIPAEHWGDEQKDIETVTDGKPNTNIDVSDPNTCPSNQHKSGRPIKPIVYVDEGEIIKKENSDQQINSLTDKDLTKENLNVQQDVEIEDTKEIECENFEFENQTYLITNDNKLYDINTEDYVGIFDHKSKSIIQ
jgi:hypothetical protein